MNRLQSLIVATLLVGAMALAGCSASARVHGEEHGAAASGSVGEGGASGSTTVR